MRISPFTLLLAVIAATVFIQTASAETRAFTSSDGKTLNAEIETATADTVTLKLADGKPVMIPLARLAPADQDFVKTWLKANPPTIHYNFDVSWTKEKAGSSTKGVNNTKIVTNKYVTHIKITNRSGQAVENIGLNYQIYYSDMEGAATLIKHHDGKQNIPLIKSGETITVDAEPVSLSSKQLDGGFYYTDGSASRKIDTFKGIAATLKHDGKQIFEFVSQGVKKAPEKAESAAPKKKP
jgi:hypothetical protein